MAKRRTTRRGQEKRARSPYSKYGKRPYAYSAQYQAWFNAVRHNRGSISHAGEQHSQYIMRGHYRQAA